MKRLHIQNPIGIKGEEVACQFLEKRGYKIVCRNYLKKWGEIDIVSEKGSKLYFTEVKAVSREINLSFKDRISHETDQYRPEDNLHSWKLKRLRRVIQSYLLEFYEEDEPDWEFNVAIVYLDMNKKMAHVKLLEDIVL